MDEYYDRVRRHESRLNFAYPLSLLLCGGRHHPHYITTPPDCTRQRSSALSKGRTMARCSGRLHGWMALGGALVLPFLCTLPSDRYFMCL